MAPIPVIGLLSLGCFAELVIFLVMLLEVAPVSLILFAIPLMNVFVSMVFILPGLFLGWYSVIVTWALLAADRGWKNERRAKCNRVDVPIHKMLPLPAQQESSHSCGPFGFSPSPGWRLFPLR